MKFETRTTADCALSLSEEAALDNFVAKTEAIGMNEAGTWQQEQREAADAAPRSGATQQGAAGPT